MTTLHKGKEALDDNFARYVSAERDPAMFNVNVAMMAILDGMLKIQKDLESIERKINQLK